MSTAGKMRRSWLSAGTVAALCAAVLAPCLSAQVSAYGNKQMGTANDKPPAILNGVGMAHSPQCLIAIREAL